MNMIDSDSIDGRRPVEDRPENPYGRCPHCDAPGVEKDRSPDGNTKCENGHVYPSKAAVY